MSSKLESPRSIALLAGIACYASAFVVIVGLGSWLTNQDDPHATGVDGVVREVKPYPEAEARGRETYGNQVCFHCHSQFVRPVNDEDLRWGPVSQTGEYAWDLPHYFGTRRTGPDLHREGLLRVDDWHFAHFFNPRYTVPHSVMPGFVWLFDKNPRADRVASVLALLDTNGDGVVSTTFGDDNHEPPEAIAAEVRKVKDWRDNQDPDLRLDRRGLKGPPTKNSIDGKAIDSMWFEEAPEAGDNLVTDYDGGELPTEKCLDLVKYLQRLGTSIGMWRRPIAAPTPPRVSPFDAVAPRPRRPEAVRVYGYLRYDAKRMKDAEAAREDWTKKTRAWDAENPLLAERLVKGKELFAKHCAGCHGDEGRGNGQAARFFYTRPRDFTAGQYKFRSTPVGKLPLDGDLYRSIFRGLPGSAMPPWRELSDGQIWLLVDYIKSIYEGDDTHHFNERTQAVPTSPEHFDTSPMTEVMRGRAIYLSGVGQCYNCHGLEGRADGPGWNTQSNTYGAAMRPRDFRPRLRFEDAEELYGLMGKKIEKLVGAEAWKTLGAAPAWKALAPTDEDKAKAEAKRKAFILFLLGEGPRVVEVFGQPAVETAFGDRYKSLFSQGDDALESVRMSAATEKDQPALRMRNGVTSEDLYRIVMSGIEGTAMKATWSDFWDKKTPEGGRPWHPKEPKQDAKFEFVPKDGVEAKISIATGDPRLKAVGVYEKTVDGKVEEWIKMQPGDDWALVHYLQWLMCVPRERTGN
jgi:cbb3-type cytochrome c oxidase subunit II